MNKVQKISVAGSIVVILFFISSLFRPEPDIQKPFINMEIEPKITKNSVEITGVPIVTGEIHNDIKSGSYVLQGTIIIPKETKITIEPGTKFYANRDARLIVNGKLTAEDTSFQSNQVYSQRKYWHGLTAENFGEIKCKNCLLSDATTAITGTGKSRVEFSGKTQNCVVGIAVMDSAIINVVNSTLEKGNVGILALSGEIFIDNSFLNNLIDGIRVFHVAKINISNPKFALISRNSIRYLNNINLEISASKEQAANILSSVYDSNDQQTYFWNRIEYKTGTVFIKN